MWNPLYYVLTIALESTFTSKLNSQLIFRFQSSTTFFKFRIGLWFREAVQFSFPLSDFWAAFLSETPSTTPAISHFYAGLVSGLLVYDSPANSTLTKSLWLCTETQSYVWQDLWLTPDLSFVLRGSWSLTLLYKSQS